MPIYEYKCQKCNAHVEELQKMTDKPLTKCKKCGGKLEKQWSNTSFQLKGSGWYVTDYARKKADGGDAKEPGKSSEGAGPAAGESKPASTETKDTSTTKDIKDKKKAPAKPSTPAGGSD